MKMARNPTPTALHEMRGSFEKNPQRKRSGEPQVKAGIGPYPSERPTDPAACWDLIVDGACPGVLGDADRVSMQIAADLLAKHNSGDIQMGERNQLISLLSRMGMTPSDRAKLAVPGESDDDGWNEL